MLCIVPPCVRYLRVLENFTARLSAALHRREVDMLLLNSHSEGCQVFDGYDDAVGCGLSRDNRDSVRQPRACGRVVVEQLQVLLHHADHVGICVDNIQHDRLIQPQAADWLPVLRYIDLEGEAAHLEAG